jgi:spore coat polysaccharide biosynthesis protein SpsF (cytidylyltransferase family)
VDEPPDFELVSRIFQALYPVNKEFGLKDIIKLLDTNPELIAINKSVKQRRPVAP